MSKEVKYSDPNMYAEGVLAYREQFNLTPNAGFRRDIAVTIQTYDDLCIWTALIANWGYWRDGKYHTRNPLQVKNMLTVFEMKKREKENAKLETGVARHSQTSTVPTRGGKRVPQRRPSNLSQMSYEPPNNYFRTR